MFIADAQAHIWAANSPARPWVAGRVPHRATALAAEELLQLMTRWELLESRQD